MAQFDPSQVLFSLWGLTEIPFTTSAPATLRQDDQLQAVFSGRDKELEQALVTLSSRERRRILIYGQSGIGKTAFLNQLLTILRQQKKRTLAAYIRLPPEAQNLATFALIALARQMPNDQYAQYLLRQVGLRPRRTPVIKETELDAKFVKTKETQIPLEKLPQFSTLSFEDLLEQALQEYAQVIIAIDDLNKDDPHEAVKLLLDAQNLLSGNASFILASYHSNLADDDEIKTSGLIDRFIELSPLDLATTRQMLFNYLNSARPETARYPIDHPSAFKPFNHQAASELCQESAGIPRSLNRLGSDVLNWAFERREQVLTPLVVRQWRSESGHQFPHQILKPSDDDIVETALAEQLAEGQVSEPKPILIRSVQRLEPRPLVLISYSQAEEKEKDELLSQLGVLEPGLIELWSRDRVEAGADWKTEIAQAISKARIAILLISANYLSSDSIHQEEIRLLLQHRDREGLTILPIIAKAYAWEKVDWLANMNVRPKSGRPVWSDGGSHALDHLAVITRAVSDIVIKQR